MTIRSTFSVEYPKDKTVIAAQDSIAQLGWEVLEMSSSRMVITLPKLQPLQVTNFPKMTVEFASVPSGTDLSIAVTMVGGKLMYFGSTGKINGMVGQFTNALSLRIQTNSVSINPTVAIGEGQSQSVSSLTAASRDRASQLKDLKELLDDGVLSDEEFAAEKARLLADA